MTAYEESVTGLMVPRNGHAPSDAAGGYAVMLELYESRLRELELQLADQGWNRLDGGAGREFGRDALGKIVDLARVMYLKNPLIRRAVEIGALYVWGQDLSFNAADEKVQEVIDRFRKDNRATLTGQQASRLIEVELEVTGNVFLALFRDTSTGQVRVRGVPMEEIRQIITNPEDRAEVWYYQREWTEPPIDGGQPVTKKALYPDWRYVPANKPERNGELEVRWDSPLLHVKSGAFQHWRWGVPEVYAALDWARAYKEQLEDDATRSRALAKFAWQVTTTRGKAGVSAIKAKLGTTVGTTSGETNPPPVAGAAAVMDGGTDLKAISIASAVLPADHSRPARLMTSAALGVPDHFFDADVGNFATSKTLDRPTELRFNERREMWKDTLDDLCQWVIDRDLEAQRGILSGTITDEQREVDLSWPDLLEPDVVARVQAVGAAAPYLPEELTSRLMMTALNVEDVDGELANLKAEQATKPPAPTPPVPPEPTTEAARLAEKKKLSEDLLQRGVAAWKAAADQAHQDMLDAEIAAAAAA